MTAMGTDVLDRLVLRGDETVLDAGCGTGNVTRLLHERLPRGHVIAVDAAPSMVEQARELLPADVDVRQADLLELELDAPVDAILSTATFHWVAGPRAAVREAARGAEAGRPARRAVRRPRQRRRGQAGRARASPPRRRTRSTSPAGRPTGRSRRRRRPSSGCAPPASPTSGAGSPAWTSTPATRSRYLRAICLGSFLDAAARGRCATPFVAATRSRGSPTRCEIHYVRLNILARGLAVTTAAVDTKCRHGRTARRRGDPRGARHGARGASRCSTAATSPGCSATSCAARATPSSPPTCAPRRSPPRSTARTASTRRAGRRSPGSTGSRGRLLAHAQRRGAVEDRARRRLGMAPLDLTDAAIERIEALGADTALAGRSPSCPRTSARPSGRA